MKPFLILQGRPETRAADEEYGAILTRGGLAADQTRRLRLEQGGLPDDLSLDRMSGIIMGGGPACVSDDPAKRSPDETRIVAGLERLLHDICAHDLPFLGCCYGIGALAHFLGGSVSTARFAEPVGITACHVTDTGRMDPMLHNVPDAFAALVGHKEAVQALPPGCVHLVRSDPCPFQMIRYRSNIYATQFHPEADADSFALRIGIYADRGYFDADAAESLIGACRAESVVASHLVLANFVNRYRED